MPAIRNKSVRPPRLPAPRCASTGPVGQAPPSASCATGEGNVAWKLKDLSRDCHTNSAQNSSKQLKTAQGRFIKTPRLAIATQEGNCGLNLTQTDSTGFIPAHVLSSAQGLSQDHQPKSCRVTHHPATHRPIFCPCPLATQRLSYRPRWVRQSSTPASASRPNQCPWIAASPREETIQFRTICKRTSLSMLTSRREIGNCSLTCI